MFGPQSQGFALFLVICRPIVDTGNTALVVADVIDNRLDYVRMYSELGRHAGDGCPARSCSVHLPTSAAPESKVLALLQSKKPLSRRPNMPSRRNWLSIVFAASLSGTTCSRLFLVRPAAKMIWSSRASPCSEPDDARQAKLRRTFDRQPDDDLGANRGRFRHGQSNPGWPRGQCSTSACQPRKPTDDTIGGKSTRKTVWQY